MSRDFEDITNRKEILSILFEAIDESFPAMMWQEREDGRKQFISGYLREVNEDKVAIGLLQDEKNPTEIKKGIIIKLNVTGNYANFYFQGRLNFLSTSNLVINVPNKIRLQNKKKKNNFFYENSEDNLVTYKLLNQKKGKKTYKVQIISLTPSKLTFYSDEMGGGKLDVGEEILITSLSKHKIPKFQVGKVKYICYFGNYSQEGNVRRPARVMVKLIPSISNLETLKLFVAKEEKRFGMEEIEWIQKQNGTFVPKKETNNENAFEYGYKQDGFFYGYEVKEQAAVLHEISLRDERLSLALRENCDYLESLVFLTTNMRQELFRDVDVAVIAFAFRLSTRFLISEMMGTLSKNLKSELLYNLREKKTATAVLKSQKEVIRYVRQREAVGSFVLDHASYNKKVS